MILNKILVDFGMQHYIIFCDAHLVLHPNFVEDVFTVLGTPAQRLDS